MFPPQTRKSCFGAALLLTLAWPGPQAQAACVTLTVTSTQSLAFGDFAPNGSGTVVIDTSGGRSATGGVFLLGGTWQQALFDVNGDSSCTYAVSLPASVSISNGSETMTVDSFASSPSATGLLDISGYQQLSVGATLNVNASQGAGSYSGFFTVTADYN